MKIKLLFFFIVLSAMATAQERKIYLDSTYVVTDEAHQVYYRIIKDFDFDKRVYPVLQYYKTGELESEQSSTSKERVIHTGTATSYYKNGNKKVVITYDEKGFKDGQCLFWYENGKPKFEGSFVKTRHQKNGIDALECNLRIDNYWNSNNEQTASNGNGQYTDDGFFDYLSNSSTSTGAIVNGYKEGIWTGKDDRRGITFTETYSNGKTISGKSIDKNGNEHIYEEAFVIAQAKGGMKQFYSYVGKNFNVPENITKRVTTVTIFTVTTQNQITGIKNITSAGEKADTEAIRVIMAFNDFTAAKYRGISIDSQFTLPITLQAVE